MEKINRPEPEVFLQTRPTTCGIACMMMILHFFRGIKLTTSIEGKFHHRMKLKGYDIIPAISIASYLKKQGLRILVYHQKSYLFWEKLLSIDPVMHDLQGERYKYARATGIEVDKHTEINDNLFKSHLDKGALIICGIDLPGEIKHAVLLYNMKNDTVFYIDPIFGKQITSTEKLVGMMQTSSGTWCIVVYDS